MLLARKPHRCRPGRTVKAFARAIDKSASLRAAHGTERGRKERPAGPERYAAAKRKSRDTDCRPAPGWSADHHWTKNVIARMNGSQSIQRGLDTTWRSTHRKEGPCGIWEINLRAVRNAYSRVGPGSGAGVEPIARLWRP